MDVAGRVGDVGGEVGRGEVTAGLPSLNPRMEVRDPKTLTLLEVNAHFMTKEKFDALVENVRRDGVLTSVPLVYADPDDGTELVLSGNHRTRAAIEAGLAEIPVLLIDQKLSRQQQVAIQLSHNSIFGEDDPDTLAMLYEELDDIDWRTYSGLDDKVLDLLDDPTAVPFAEANLTYQTVQLVFLPPEKEVAEQALFEVKKLHGISDMWLGALPQYEPMLAALETVRGSYSIGNVATALGIILAVFEEHLTDVADGWVDKSGDPRRNKSVPMETVFGTRMVPSSTAAVILQAMKAAQERGDITDITKAWVFMEFLAADYLAGG